MAIPMYLLYEGGLLMARVLHMKREATKGDEAQGLNS